jgi:hypothetical protein
MPLNKLDNFIKNPEDMPDDSDYVCEEDFMG